LIVFFAKSKEAVLTECLFETSCQFLETRWWPQRRWICKVFPQSDAHADRRRRWVDLLDGDNTDSPHTVWL